MDRLEFSESLDVFADLQLKSFFNEVMGMYSLYSRCSDAKIDGSVSEGKIFFDLQFRTKKEAKDNYNMITSNRVIEVYGSSYLIRCSLINKTIKIYFDKVFA